MISSRILENYMKSIFDEKRTKLEAGDDLSFTYLFIQTIQPKDKPAYKQAVFVSYKKEVRFSSAFRIVEQAEHLLSMNGGSGYFEDGVSCTVIEKEWYADKTTLSLQF